MDGFGVSVTATTLTSRSKPPDANGFDAGARDTSSGTAVNPSMGAWRSHPCDRHSSAGIPRSGL